MHIICDVHMALRKVVVQLHEAVRLQTPAEGPARLCSVEFTGKWVAPLRGFGTNAARPRLLGLLRIEYYVTVPDCNDLRCCAGVYF